MTTMISVKSELTLSVDQAKRLKQISVVLKTSIRQVNIKCFPINKRLHKSLKYAKREVRWLFCDFVACHLRFANIFRHNSVCGFEADEMPEEHVSCTISVSSFILSSNIADMAIMKAPISSSMLTLGAIEAIYDFITYSSMKKRQFCIQLGQNMSLTPP